MTDTSPRYEVAHLAHAELFTPNLDGTLWFFTELLGMYESERIGDSVYLRAYEDPYHHSLKVTAADRSGIGTMGWRTTSREALERRAAVLDKAGLGTGPTKGDAGVGETFGFQTPDGHSMELVWDVEKYRAPADLASPILTRPSKRPLKGVPIKRLDHVNLLASDVTAQKTAMHDYLGFGAREVMVDGDTEVGAWMSVNALGHELAVMKDAMGAKARLHHLAFYFGFPQHNFDFMEVCREQGIEMELGPGVHGATQGHYFYVFEPGGNRIELFGHPGILELEPDFETRVWTVDAFMNKGGVSISAPLFPEEFMIFGTPVVREDGVTEHRVPAGAVGSVESNRAWLDQPGGQ